MRFAPPADFSVVFCVKIGKTMFVVKKILAGITAFLSSAAVGLVNGFFGGGGGMLLVPLLERASALSVKEAHATAIAVILPTSLAGAITYVAGGTLDLAATIAVACGCVAGGIAGAWLLKKLPARVVAIAFAAIMTAVGIKLTFF